MVMDSIIISPLLLLLYVTTRTVRELNIAIFWIEMFLSNIIVHAHRDKRVVQKQACRVLEEMNQSCRASVERDTCIRYIHTETKSVETQNKVIYHT